MFTFSVRCGHGKLNIFKGGEVRHKVIKLKYKADVVTSSDGGQSYNNEERTGAKNSR